MMTPPPFFCISGAARPVPRITACKSISITRCHRSGGASGNPGAPTPMPALLCRMSRRPYFETAVSSIFRASSSLVTSAFTNTARPPALSMRLTVSAPPVSSRSATTIAAPSFASRSDVARPIPDEPPVMTPTFPLISIARSSVRKKNTNRSLTHTPNQHADDQSREYIGRQRNISVVAFPDEEDEAERDARERNQGQREQPDGQHRMRIAFSNPVEQEAELFLADETALLHRMVALDEVVGREGVIQYQSGNEQDHRGDQNRPQQNRGPLSEYSIFFLFRHRSDPRQRAPSHLSCDQQKNYHENDPEVLDLDVRQHAAADQRAGRDSNRHRGCDSGGDVAPREKYQCAGAGGDADHEVAGRARNFERQVHDVVHRHHLERA